MRSFIAFLKKEFLEALRTGKLMILAILFLIFGIMNPAIAKLTPFLLEIMSDELAGSGMTVTEVTVDALTSWTQFFKNIPMALMAFVLMCGGIFTKEYESGSLLLVITKGISRYKIVLAKTVSMLVLWSAGYWFCFGITYVYNAYFWDNSIASGLIPAVTNMWLFGIFVIALIVFFSVTTRSFSGVLLGTGGSVVASYIISFYPKAVSYLPTSLMNSALLLAGAETADEYTKAVAVTMTISICLIISSIPIFNKKQL